MTRDYSEVTEVAGNRLTRQAIEMMYTRYRFAAGRCRGRAVLEIACGAGQGMSLLQSSAATAVGGDCTRRLLVEARRHYAGRVPFVEFDAHEIPFRAESFDATLLFEAIYYLGRPPRFLAECRRVLRPGGILMICSVNPEWADFNPSPHSTRYPSAPELARLLIEAGFRAEFFAAFPAGSAGIGGTAVAILRRVAVALRLVPRSMEGKAWLKRLFYGKLREMPPELSDPELAAPEPVPVEPGQVGSRWKVYYALGTVPAAQA
jgi:ubiquinone/menaquinone biosynthesis C-methylase UbiE